MAGAIQRPQNGGGTLAVQQQLVVALLWTILGLAIALAALLMTRRISGAFQKPLGGAAMVLTGLLTELSVIAYRRLYSRGGSVVAFQYSVLGTQYPALRSRTDVQPILLVFILTSLVALTVLISLTIPGTPLVALLLAWLIVIASEIAQWQSHFRLNWTIPQSILIPPIPPPPPRINETEPAEPEPTEPEIPAGLIQQVTRVLEDEQESIHALIKATIAANDRQAIVHLAFCPPLANKPELTAHALDTDEADVRITQAETFGARLEIRLPKADPSERCLIIELLGSAPHVGRASSRP